MSPPRDRTFFTSKRFLLALLLVPLGVSTSIAAAILNTRFQVPLLRMRGQGTKTRDSLPFPFPSPLPASKRGGGGESKEASHDTGLLKAPARAEPRVSLPRPHDRVAQPDGGGWAQQQQHLKGDARLLSRAPECCWGPAPPRPSVCAVLSGRAQRLVRSLGPRPRGARSPGALQASLDPAARAGTGLGFMRRSRAPRGCPVPAGCR